MQKLLGRIKAITPISHSMGTEGITSPLRRENFIIDNKVVQVPVISGNAIRGVLRRHGAKVLLELLGVEPSELPPMAYHLLHDGGIIEEAVHIEPDVEFLRQVRKYIPLVSLFGGCVRQTPLSGKLIVNPAIPITQETERYTGVKTTVRLADIVHEVAFTRRDDREMRRLSSPVQMLYLVECFAAGTEFIHSFILKTNDPIELGSFHAALRSFNECPFLGGRSAAGLGQIEWTYKPDDSLIAKFTKFVKQNAQTILDTLHALG